MLKIPSVEEGNELVAKRFIEVVEGLKCGGLLARADVNVNDSYVLVEFEGRLIRKPFYSPLTKYEHLVFRVTTLLDSLENLVCVVTPCGTRVYVLSLGYEYLLYTSQPSEAYKTLGNRYPFIDLAVFSQAAWLASDVVQETFMRVGAEYSIDKVEMAPLRGKVRRGHGRMLHKYLTTYNPERLHWRKNDAFWPTNPCGLGCNVSERSLRALAKYDNAFTLQRMRRSSQLLCTLASWARRSQEILRRSREYVV